MLIIGAVEHTHDYRFERGAELEFWTMGYLRTGRIRTRTRQGEYIRAGGSISLIPPHTTYALEWAGTDETWSEIYSVFAPPAHWNSLLTWPVRDHGFGVLEIEDTNLRAEVEKALLGGAGLLRSARPRKVPLALNLVERVLLLLDEVNPLRGYGPLDGRVQQALEYIAVNYADEINLDILAAHVCLSSSRFAHLFRAQMHVAPIQYVERFRLERAAERLLSTNDSIELIARECGFANAFHFSTRFRQHFDKSPSKYRVNP